MNLCLALIYFSTNYRCTLIKDLLTTFVVFCQIHEEMN